MSDERTDPRKASSHERQMAHARHEKERRELCTPVEIRTEVIPATPGWYAFIKENHEEDDGKWVDKVVAYPVVAWITNLEPPDKYSAGCFPSLIPLITEGVNSSYDSVGEPQSESWIVLHESQVDSAWLKKHTRAKWLDECLAMLEA